MDNLKLKYTLVANEAESNKNLDEAIKDLQQILKNRKELKLHVGGFDNVTRNFKSVIANANELKNILASISKMKLNLVSTQSDKLNFKEQTRQLNELIKTIEKKDKELANLQSRISKKEKDDFSTKLENFKSKKKQRLESAFIKDEIPAKEYGELLKNLDRLKENSPKISKEMSDISRKIEDAISSQKNYNQLQKQDLEIKKKTSKTIDSITASIEKQKRAVQSKLNIDKEAFGKLFDHNSFNKIEKQFEKISGKIVDPSDIGQLKQVDAEIKNINSSLDKLMIASRKSFNIDIFKKKMMSDLDSAVVKNQMSADEKSSLVSRLNSLNPNSDMLHLHMASIKSDMDSIVSKNKVLLEVQRKVANENKKINKELSDQEKITNKIANYQKSMGMKMNEYKKNFGGLVSDSGFKSIKDSVDALSSTKFSSMDELKNKMQNINMDFANLKNNTMGIKKSFDGASTSTVSFGDAVRNAAEKFSIWSVVTVAWFETIRALKDSLRITKEMNSAMVDVQRVTNETADTYKDFEKSVHGIGRSFAQTGTSVVHATTNFARMGYTLKEASEIAKEALLLSNVGDMGVQDASDAMISAVKGFQIPIDKVRELNDAMNELGNTMPITVAGLSEALKRSAAVMSYTGNTYQETLALIATANGVVQNPEKIGNALRTITLRMTGAEDKETGENYADIVPKLEEDFGKLGIQIQDTNGKLRSTFDLLIELGKAFEKSNMTDIEKTNMLETIAGKYNVNVAAAIISNYKEAEKALASAMNSSGSAMRENEKYIESIEGKLNILKNTSEEFWMNIVDSESLKGSIDLLTNIVQLFSAITSNKIGSSAFLTTTGVTAFTLLTKQTNNLNVLISKLFHTLSYNGKVPFLENISKGLLENSSKARDLKSDLDAFRKILIDTKEKRYKDKQWLEDNKHIERSNFEAGKIGDTDFKDFSKKYEQTQQDVKNAPEKIKNLNANIQETKAAYTAATLKSMAFNAVAAIGFSILISASLEAISTLRKKFLPTVDELKQKLNDAQQSYQKIKEQIEDYNKSLESNKNRIKEIEDLKKSVGISEKEEKELESLQKQNDELQRKLNIELELSRIAKEEQNKAAERFLSDRNELNTANKKHIAFVDVAGTDPITKPDKLKSDIQEYKTLQDTYSNMLKEIDQNRWKLSQKEIEDKSNQLKSLEQKVSEKRTQIAELAKEVSDASNNLNDGALKTDMLGLLESVNDILSNRSTSSNIEGVSDSIDKVSESVKSLSDQMDVLNDRQKDMTSYVNEYNEKGVLSAETVSEMLKKYPDMVNFLNQTAEGYKLNTGAIEHLNQITNAQIEIVNEQIRQKQSEIESNKEYIQSSNDMLNAIASMVDSKQKLKDMDSVSSGDLSIESFIESMKQADDVVDGSKIKEFISVIQNINNEFANGKSSAKEYFNSIRTAIKDIDFSDIKTDESVQALFSNISGTIASGIKDIVDQFQNGSITISEYTTSLMSANKAMLDTYTSANELSYRVSDGVWIDASGEIDEYATSLSNATKSIDDFDGYVNVIMNNVDYLRENINSLGDAAFDAADETSSHFQQLATDMESMLNDIAITNHTVFEEIISDMANILNTSADSLLEADGTLKEGLLSNGESMNAAMAATNKAFGKTLGNVLDAAGNVIKSFGEMIADFDYKITVRPNIDVKGGMNPTDFVQGLINGKINLPAISWDFKGSGGSNGKVNAFANSIQALGTAVSDISKVELNFNNLLPKPKSRPNAPRKEKKSGGGKKGSGADIDPKDIQKVEEYEQAIKRLDLAINELTSSRDKLIEGSDEYNDSIRKELLLVKEKEKLTKEELKRIQEELKKYTDLDKVKEKLEKANQKGTKATKESNKAIDSYNKRLKEKTDLENKAIQLQNTIIDLQKKQEDILRKQADIIANSSNKKISKLELEISLIESRQKLVSEDSKDYFDFQADKIDLLIKKQQQLRADITATQALLAMASKLGYSGDQIEKWQDDVINAKKQILDTEYEIREAGKQQRISDVKNVIDDVSSYVETLNNVMSNFDMKLSLLDSDDYVNKVDTLGKAMGFAVTKVSSLQNAMSRLQSVQPQTKEEAQELADQMSNVAKQVLEARKAAFEYQKQMDLLVVDQLSSKYHAEFEKLNTLMTAFSHNIEMLEGGLLDGTDIDFGIGILPDIPQSAYDKESAELDKMIAEHEAYEAEIQKIRQMSFEEQEKMQKKFDEEMLNEKGEIDEETKKRTSDTYDMIIRTIAEAMGLNLDNISDGHKHQLDVIKSALFETKDIYKMTWAEIVNIVSASLSAVQNATTQGLHSYTNFDANGKFLGITYGKSGQSNFMKDAAYIGAENGKYYNTDGTGERKNVPEYLKKRVPKYASGTDGHPGGVALISEYDREEMVVFPNGSTKVFKNATLVDLPEGSQVLNPEETKDVKRYIGNKFDNGKIPKYAKGTGKKRRVKKSMDEEAAEWNSNVTDTVVIDNRKIDIKNVDYSKNYQSWNQSEKAQQDRNDYDKSKITNRWHHTNTGTPFGEPIGYDLLKSGIRPSGFSATGHPLYDRNDGGAFAYTDKYGFTHTTTSYITALTFSRDGVIKNWSGKHYGGYAYDDDGSRLHLADMPNSNMFGNFSKDGYYNDIAYDENGNPYTVRKYGGKDAVYSGKLSSVNLQNLPDILAGKYADNIKNNDFTSALNQHLQSSSTGMYGSAYGSYSSDGKYNYYNREDKTEHEKRIDKARYDVFLSQAIASEFKQYKQARETAMATIKAEQEAIKKHFADGGIRDTVENQIQSLLDKIDIQTSKDVGMNFKLTEDILKQQKEQTEAYMKETQQKYLNGISSGLSTEALRKLRDEYNDAQKEYMNIEKALKDNTRARFEYEFAMMDKKTQKIKDQQDLVRMDIEYMKLVRSTDLQTAEKYYDIIIENEEKLQKQYEENIKLLSQKQNLYSVGSNEWNILEERKKLIERSKKDSEQSIQSNKKEKYEYGFSLFDNEIKEIQDNKNLISLNTELLRLKSPNSHQEIDSYYKKAKEEEEKIIKKYEKQIGLVKEKLKVLQEGSLEWKIHNDEVKKLEIGLVEANLRLLKMNKDIEDNRVQSAKSVESMIISMIQKRVEKEKMMLQRSLSNYEKIANEKIKIISKTQDDKQFSRWLKKEKEGIQEIQDQLNKLALDDSLEAKYQHSELSKALKERKENLDISLENKSNDDRIKNIQDLVEKERERTRILISNLDQQLTSESLHAEARKALQSGVFKYMVKSTKEMNGEIIDSYNITYMSLKEASVSFMNEFGEGMSITGDKIKNDFIHNLNMVSNKLNEIMESMRKYKEEFLDVENMKVERSFSVVDVSRRMVPVLNPSSEPYFTSGMDRHYSQSRRGASSGNYRNESRIETNYDIDITIGSMNGNKKDVNDLASTMIREIERRGGRF